MTEFVLDPGPLPIRPTNKKSASWWGVMCLIATEAALFAYLQFSYYYMDVQLPHSWRPDAPQRLHYSLPDTIILILSSVAVWFGERALKQDRRGRSILWILVGWILGAIFVAVQLLEWKVNSKGFTPQSGPYGSLYFTTTGFHLAHVIAGLIALGFIMIWLGLGYFDSRRTAAVSNVAIYWHFVDAVWVTLFFMFYISPHIW